MTIQDAIRSISRNRLATYKDRIGVATDEQSLGLYLWNKKLCSAFLPVLQLLEISLRNAIHIGYLEHQKKQILALGPPPADLNTLLDRAWFKTFFDVNRTQHSESYKQIQLAEHALLKMGRAADIDQTIAKLSFGFWTHLCSKRHNDSNTDSLMLWPTIRDEVFPAAKRGANYLSMREIQETLAQINDIRNRIAHHEPIWHASHLYDLPAFVNKLIRDFEKCLDIIGWINPANLKTVALMESALEFAHLCKPATIHSFQQLGDEFHNVAAVDPAAWAATCLVEERHNGVVITATTQTTVIKSLKDKKTFVLDTMGASAKQASLGLKLHESVNFRPVRWQNGAGKIILLARSVERGHI